MEKTAIACAALIAALPALAGAQTCRSDAAREIVVSNVTGSLQNPCFSPDCRALAFTNFTTAYNRGKAIVKSVPVAGGAASTLSPTTAQSVNLPGQCWRSPANEVAYSSDVADDRDEIYLVPAAGGAARRVTNRPGYLAWEPSVSPVLADGSQWIVFESHTAGTNIGPGELWKVNLATGDLLRLTSGFDDAQPEWSPRGDRIVFQRRRPGHDAIDVYTIGIDGSAATQLTRDGESTDPSWSPSGNYIFYSGGGDGIEVANLFVIAAAGGRATRVTTSCGLDGAPGWSADGSQIAFESSPVDPDASGSTTLWVIAAPPGMR